MSVPHDAGAPAAARPPTPSRAATLTIFTAVAVAVLLAAAGLLAWRGAERGAREGRAREMAALAALKVEQVVRWRNERLSDAQTLAHDPELGAALAARSVRGSRGAAEIGTWLQQLRSIGDYTAVALLDAAGEIVFAVGAVDRNPGPLRALVHRAAVERRAAMSDVHGSERDPPHVDVVGPVTDEGGAALGAVLLRVDPRPYLFRIVESWHEPSPSAEVLLVRPEGAGAVALNPGSGVGTARFPPGGAIAAAVTSRKPAAIDGVDDRGSDVLGAVAPVPGSAWSVVVKEDATDTLGPLRERAMTLGIAALAVLVAAGAVVSYWARREADRLDRERAVGEAERGVLARRLARLTTHAHDMVLAADGDQRIVEANEQAVRLLGYSRDELLGMPVRELRDPATVGDYSERVRQQVERGTAMFETRFRRKDGSTFPVAITVNADEYEGRRWFDAVARDISDRERAEEALRESEAKFRAAFEFARLGVLLAGADGRIVETNRALREMTGFAEDELRGASISVLHDPADTVTTGDALLVALANGEMDGLELPRRIRRKDGSLAESVVRASALRDQAGRMKFLLAMFEDVSEKKRLEAQLLLADRMASVGTLAAGVAHEINNPLAFILSNLEFAIDELRRSGADTELLRALGDARDGGSRVREIVRDLKTFSRPVDEVREALDVRAVLQSAIGLASNELRHRARVVVEPGEVPRVAASEHRLGQVLLNLLINAAQAIPEGRIAENVVRVATSTAPDGRALIEISDTGEGIPPEVLPRIFDPFFTTKPVGVGTGLGLSICHGIVTQLGGEISVESAPGKGSTFRVHLPPAARAPDPALPAESAPPQRARVLVIDDEPLVGRAIARILDAQHEVVLRASAREALGELLDGGGFDVVLCDLMMPELTGMELHGRLVRDAPAVAARTVFLTGGAFTDAAREFLDRVPNLRLEKPFEPQALRDVVAGALAATARRGPPAAGA